MVHYKLAVWVLYLLVKHFTSEKRPMQTSHFIILKKYSIHLLRKYCGNYLKKVFPLQKKSKNKLLQNVPRSEIQVYHNEFNDLVGTFRYMHPCKCV